MSTGVTVMSETPTQRVGLVIAAHAPLAGAMQQTARHILGERAGNIAIVEIGASDMPAISTAAVAAAVASADAGAGVLVLADLFGGSAANVALSQLGKGQVEVVTGTNLAMVLEAVTSAARGEPLSSVAALAADAGRASVVVAGQLIAPISAGERPAA